MARELNEIDLKIIELYNNGLGTRLIGQQVGKSKNAICGLISRYREWGALELKREKKTYPKAMVKKNRLRVIGQTVSKRKLQYLAAVQAEKLMDPSLATGGIDFWALKSNSCRYIINRGKPEMFCGSPQEHKSYCLYHAAVCYTQPPPKTGKPFKFYRARP